MARVHMVEACAGYDGRSGWRSGWRVRGAGLATLILLAFGATGAYAQSSDPLGPLRAVVGSQLQPGWGVDEESAKSWFVLKNDSQEKAEQALTVDAGPVPTSGRVVGANLAVFSDRPNASVGLMVSGAASADLCLMEIAADAKANLFCVVAGKTVQVASVPKAAKLNGEDRVEMIEDATGARFLLNGQVIGDVTQTSALGGKVGVMAYDLGTFGIAGFSVDAIPGNGNAGGNGGTPAPSAGAGTAAPGDEVAAILGPMADAMRKAAPLDGWAEYVQGGQVVLENPSTQKSSRIVTYDPGAVSQSGRRFVMQAGLMPPEGQTLTDVRFAAVGIYIESPDRKNSCVGEITAQNLAVVLCFDEAGKARQIGQIEGAARLDGSDVIEFIEFPGEAAFVINGQVLAKLDSPAALGGEVGILAYDRGRFSISQFMAETLSETATGTATGQSADSQVGGAPAGGTNTGGSSSGGGQSMGDMIAGEGPVPQFDGSAVRRIGVYLGISQSIFMHEFGHALIGELQLPSTGPEEDAVDIFSALQIVDPTIYASGDQEIDDIGREVAVYAALQWFYSGKLAEAQGGGETPWQDEHTADLKRFRNIFCVIYGGNAEVFGPLAEGVGISDRTLSRCEGEYNKQNRAWRTILAPHTRVDAWHPEGQLPVSAPGAQVTVKFEPSRSKVGEFVRAAFTDGLTGYAETLSKTYALPRPLTVTYKDCGELNAWYDPQEATITMCYDLIEHLVVMVSDIEAGTVNGYEQGAAPAAAGSTGGAAPASAAAGQVGGPSFQGNGSAVDEAQEFGVPSTRVLFPAPYKGPTPVQHMVAKTVSTPELVQMMQSGQNMLLIDTSGGALTLPAAMQVPDAGRDGSLTDRFQGTFRDWISGQTGGDAALPVVFFGQGLNDRSSYNAALRAGMAKVNAYWYRGGIEAWMANGLNLVEVKE